MDYLFFDLDGTLLDSGDGIMKCVQYALQTQGVEENDFHLLRRHVGPPLKQGFIDFYGFDDKRATDAVVEYRKQYKIEWKSGTTPYPGIEECLGGLKDKGIQLIVTTSKPEHLAKEFLDYFQLSQYFIDICGSVETGNKIRTTKAAVIRYAIEKNQITGKDHVFMIGDRCYDVEGASECGIPCIGVTYGFGTREELSGAIAIVDSCMELEQVAFEMVAKK